MTLVLNNVYIDKSNDTVNKYNIKHIKAQLKWNLLMPNTTQTQTLNLVKKLKIKIKNLLLVIMLEYQNIKIFLQKVTLQIGLKKFFWLKNLKILFLRHMLSLILIEKKLLECFAKQNYKKQIKKSWELKK